MLKEFIVVGFIEIWFDMCGLLYGVDMVIFIGDFIKDDGFNVGSSLGENVRVFVCCVLVLSCNVFLD